MHGRHVALFPLPGRSHVYQALGLCPELLRRGHRVSIATTEAYAPLVSQAGAEPVTFQPDRPMMMTAGLRGLRIDNPERWEEAARISSRWLLNSAAIAVRQLDQYYSDNRPDLVIYELSAYAGRIIAKRHHSLAAQYYPEFVQHRRYVCWQNSVGYDPPSIVEFSRLLDAFLWAYGFENSNHFWHSEDLNLCQLPRAFQFDADSLDSPRFCFSGPFLDRPFMSTWKNLSDGRRVILVSAAAASFNNDYLGIVIDALGESEYHVILSVGGEFQINDQPGLPSNFEINRHASHLEILPHTDLHIYSGGPTSTLESLYFGVPLIAVPMLEFNYIVANRWSELGVATNLPLYSLDGVMLREHIDAALRDTAYLQRVDQLKHVVRSLGGAATAVDRIENFMQSAR